MTATDLSPRTNVSTRVSWAPLLVVLLGTFVTFLDFFIVNVALPDIHTRLHAGPSAVSLVVAGYGLTFAVGMLTGGRLGDRYGRRRMFVLGLALFTVTSLACGLAPEPATLVAARVVQGAAGALLTPQVLAILGTIYTGARRDTAFAAYGVTMGAAAVLGQLLGGALIAADIAGLGWRAIFLINVPIGLAAIPLARRYVPESRGAQTPLDLGGVVLASGALTALVLPLVAGREHGWPVWSWLCLGIAGPLAWAFVAGQRRRGARGRAPLVDLAQFRIRSFALGSLTGLAFGLVPAAFFFVLALYLQQGRGYSALFSGVVFAMVGAGYFLAMFVATPLAARFGRHVLSAGALLVAAGCGLLAAEAHASSAGELLVGLALVGLGIGLVLVPLSATALAEVDPLHAGAASGVLTTAQQVGGALGVSLIGVVFFAGGDVVGAFVTSLLVLVGLALIPAAAAQFLGRCTAGNL